MLDQNALSIISEEYGDGRSPERDQQRSPERGARGASGGHSSGHGHDRHYATAPPSGQRKHREHRRHSNRERRFLREVQDELEGQRESWKGEVEKMIEGLHIQKAIIKDTKKNKLKSPASSGATNYVDTSSGNPIFKAYVDVSEYPPQGLNVTIDKLESKLIVTANRGTEPGNVTRSFTQKVQLPRYADDQRVRTRLNKEGILTIEVPLLFYFDPEKKQSKSFINQVRTQPDGSKSLEILVNVGAEVRPWELKVRVNDRGELVIHSEKDELLSNGETHKTRKLIKRYILPENADKSRMTSRLGEDGRLVVNVPLKYNNFNTL